MPDAISVSQLTRTIKASLNNRFASVWVEGEISGLTRATSGHVYLTLKDANAQINGIIWRSDAEQLDFEPEQGMKVICRGGVDVYPQRGTYQLIIRRLLPQGVGSLQMAFKQLHAKLQSAGLFDDQHKQPLPRLPKHIAVVTSPTGAAIRDFLQVLLRRWPNIQVTIVPAKVQGDGAASEIAAGIQTCQQMRLPPDLIVLTRGGGSIEDLWAFNEEVVVRAIFDSIIPIVAGIGHEIDITLADLAADVRALTPSEAAEKIVPNRDDLVRWVDETEKRLKRLVLANFENAQQQLAQIATRPALRRPLETIRQASIELDYLEQSLRRSVDDQMQHQRTQLSLLAERLNSTNPLQILARGYSLTTDDNDVPINRTQQVTAGQSIVTRVNDGTILSEVKSIHRKQD
jgi:exodeoxyribonuclease VII large subunit